MLNRHSRVRFKNSLLKLSGTNLRRAKLHESKMKSLENPINTQESKILKTINKDATLKPQYFRIETSDWRMQNPGSQKNEEESNDFDCETLVSSVKLKSEDTLPESSSPQRKSPCLSPRSKSSSPNRRNNESEVKTKQMDTKADGNEMKFQNLNIKLPETKIKSFSSPKYNEAVRNSLREISKPSKKIEESGLESFHQKSPCSSPRSTSSSPTGKSRQLFSNQHIFHNISACLKSLATKTTPNLESFFETKPVKNSRANSPVFGSKYNHIIKTYEARHARSQLQSKTHFGSKIPKPTSSLINSSSKSSTKSPGSRSPKILSKSRIPIKKTTYDSTLKLSKISIQTNKTQSGLSSPKTRSSSPKSRPSLSKLKSASKTSFASSTKFASSYNFNAYTRNKSSDPRELKKPTPLNTKFCSGSSDFKRSVVKLSRPDFKLYTNPRDNTFFRTETKAKTHYLSPQSNSPNSKTPLSSENTPNNPPVKSKLFTSTTRSLSPKSNELVSPENKLRPNSKFSIKYQLEKPKIICTSKDTYQIPITTPIIPKSRHLLKNKEHAKHSTSKSKKARLVSPSKLIVVPVTKRIMIKHPKIKSNHTLKYKVDPKMRKIIHHANNIEKRSKNLSTEYLMEIFKKDVDVHYVTELKNYLEKLKDSLGCYQTECPVLKRRFENHRHLYHAGEGETQTKITLAKIGNLTISLETNTASNNNNNDNNYNKNSGRDDAVLHHNAEEDYEVDSNASKNALNENFISEINEALQTWQNKVETHDHSPDAANKRDNALKQLTRMITSADLDDQNFINSLYKATDRYLDAILHRYPGSNREIFILKEGLRKHLISKINEIRNRYILNMEELKLKNVQEKYIREKQQRQKSAQIRKNSALGGQKSLVEPNLGSITISFDKMGKPNMVYGFQKEKLANKQDNNNVLYGSPPNFTAPVLHGDPPYEESNLNSITISFDKSNSPGMLHVRNKSDKLFDGSAYNQNVQLVPQNNKESSKLQLESDNSLYDNLKKDEVNQNRKNSSESKTAKNDISEKSVPRMSMEMRNRKQQHKHRNKNLQNEYHNRIPNSHQHSLDNKDGPHSYSKISNGLFKEPNYNFIQSDSNQRESNNDIYENAENQNGKNTYEDGSKVTRNIAKSDRGEKNDLLISMEERDKKQANKHGHEYHDRIPESRQNSLNNDEEPHSSSIKDNNLNGLLTGPKYNSIQYDYNQRKAHAGDINEYEQNRNGKNAYRDESKVNNARTHNYSKNDESQKNFTVISTETTQPNKHKNPSPPPFLNEYHDRIPETRQNDLSNEGEPHSSSIKDNSLNGSLKGPKYNSIKSDSNQRKASDGDIDEFEENQDGKNTYTDGSKTNNATTHIFSKNDRSEKNVPKISMEKSEKKHRNNQFQNEYQDRIPDSHQNGLNKENEPYSGIKENSFNGLFEPPKYDSRRSDFNQGKTSDNLNEGVAQQTESTRSSKSDILKSHNTFENNDESIMGNGSEEMNRFPKEYFSSPIKVHEGRYNDIRNHKNITRQTRPSQELYSPNTSTYNNSDIDLYTSDEDAKQISKESNKKTKKERNPKKVTPKVKTDNKKYKNNECKSNGSKPNYVPEHFQKPQPLRKLSNPNNSNVKFEMYDNIFKENMSTSCCDSPRVKPVVPSEDLCICLGKKQSMHDVCSFDRNYLEKEVADLLQQCTFIRNKGILCQNVLKTLLSNLEDYLSQPSHLLRKAVLKGKIVNILKNSDICTGPGVCMKTEINKFAEELAHRLVGIISRMECSNRSHLDCAITSDTPFHNFEEVCIGSKRVKKVNFKQDIMFELDKCLHNTKISNKKQIKQYIYDSILDKVELIILGIDNDVRKDIEFMLEKPNVLKKEEIVNIADNILYSCRELILSYNDSSNKRARHNTVISARTCFSGTLSIYTSEHDLSFRPTVGTSTPKKNRGISRLNREENEYTDTVKRTIEEWVTEMPPNFNFRQDMLQLMIHDLAGEIVDHTKVAQIVSNDYDYNEETVLLIFIYKWLVKYQVIEDIDFAKPYVHELIRRINHLSAPDLKKPHHGTRQHIKNVKHAEGPLPWTEPFLPEAIDILEDEISIWMNEYPTNMYVEKNKDIQNEIIHEFAEKIQPKMGNEYGENEISKEVRRWLHVQVNPNERDKVEAMAKNLIERLKTLPTDKTISEYVNKVREQRERKVLERIQKDQEKSVHEINETSYNVPINEIDQTMKLFIADYIEHNHEEKDPLMKKILLNLFKSEIIRLDQDALHKVYENKSFEKFSSEKLNVELEYIRIISEWLDIIPLDSFFNTVENKNRPELIITLAKDIVEIEEERKQTPDVLDYDSLLAGFVLQFLGHIPILPPHRNNVGYFVDELMTRLSIKRGDIKPPPPGMGILEFLENFIKEHGKEIADDKLKLAAWSARLYKEMENILQDPKMAYQTKQAIINRLADIPFPGNKTAQLFDLELTYAKEIIDCIKQVELKETVDEQCITELAQKMAEHEILAPNDNKNIEIFIYEWVKRLPFQTPEDVDIPAVAQDLVNKLRTVTEESRQLDGSTIQPSISAKIDTSKLHDSSRYKSNCRGCCPVSNPEQVMTEVINHWCDALPLEGNSTKIERVRRQLKNKLYELTTALDSQPLYENNETLLKKCLFDEIDAFMNRNNIKMDYDQILKEELVAKIVQAKRFIKEMRAGETYRQQLEGAIEKSLPSSVDKDPEIELLKEAIVDKFILDNFDHGTDIAKIDYEKKIQNEIDKFADSIVKKQKSIPIDKETFCNDIYSTLYNVEIPHEEAVVDDVEEVKTKYEVEEWFKGLPLQPCSDESGLIYRQKQLANLSKLLHECEQEKAPSTQVHEEIVKVLQTLKLQPAHEQYFDKFANQLQSRLTDTRRIRRRSKPKNKSITPANPLEKEEENADVWVNPNVTLKSIRKDDEHQRPADTVIALIEQWCQILPLDSFSVTEQMEIKDDITTKILMKISELNSCPTTLHSKILYSHLLGVEIDKIISAALPENVLMQHKNPLILQIISAIESLRPLFIAEKSRTQYRQELQDTVHKIAGSLQETIEDKELQHKLEEEIINAFFEYQYNKDDEEGKQYYKNKIIEILTNYSLQYADPQDKINIQADALIEANRLICELSKIDDLPEEMLEQEVNELRMKKEVDKFFNEVKKVIKKQKVLNSLKKSLAIQLNDIEKSGHTIENDNKMKEVVNNSLKKVVTGSQLPVSKVDSFINRLKNNEIIRKTQPYRKKEQAKLRRLSLPTEEQETAFTRQLHTSMPITNRSMSIQEGAESSITSAVASQKQQTSSQFNDANKFSNAGNEKGMQSQNMPSLFSQDGSLSNQRRFSKPQTGSIATQSPKSQPEIKHQHENQNNVDQFSNAGNEKIMQSQHMQSPYSQNGSLSNQPRLSQPQTGSIATQSPKYQPEINKQHENQYDVDQFSKAGKEIGMQSQDMPSIYSQNGSLSNQRRISKPKTDSIAVQFPTSQPEVKHQGQMRSPQTQIGNTLTQNTSVEDEKGSYRASISHTTPKETSQTQITSPQPNMVSVKLQRGLVEVNTGSPLPQIDSAPNQVRLSQTQISLQIRKESFVDPIGSFHSQMTSSLPQRASPSPVDKNESFPAQVESSLPQMASTPSHARQETSLPQRISTPLKTSHAQNGSFQTQIGSPLAHMASQVHQFQPQVVSQPQIRYPPPGMGASVPQMGSSFPRQIQTESIPPQMRSFSTQVQPGSLQRQIAPAAQTNNIHSIPNSQQRTPQTSQAQTRSPLPIMKSPTPQRTQIQATPQLQKESFGAQLRPSFDQGARPQEFQGSNQAQFTSPQVQKASFGAQIAPPPQMTRTIRAPTNLSGFTGTQIGSTQMGITRSSFEQPLLDVGIQDRNEPSRSSAGVQISGPGFTSGPPNYGRERPPEFKADSDGPKLRYVCTSTEEDNDEEYDDDDCACYHPKLRRLPPDCLEYLKRCRYPYMYPNPMMMPLGPCPPPLYRGSFLHEYMF